MKTKTMKTDNLKKWEKTLASCIRCGYCFEHCPLSKHTKWDSDTPRAKIIMAHGLVTGELEPSDYVAEKLFSCFFCKRCDAACSSGVTLTEVFLDARRDLLEAGCMVPGTTSITEDNCAACLACVRECPHEARHFENGRIVSDPIKCLSCGRCVEVCSARAAHLGMDYGTSKDELNTEVSAYLKDNKKAKTIIFACNWSYYPDLQSSRPVEADSQSHKIIVNMCGGRLEQVTLIEPFLHNAEGVLVACCPDGDCEHDGNEKAKVNVQLVKNLLQSIDMDPEKIKFVQVKHGDKAGFQKEIDTFTDQISGK